jgi:hypothetical protein
MTVAVEHKPVHPALSQMHPKALLGRDDRDEQALRRMRESAARQDHQARLEMRRICIM